MEWEKRAKEILQQMQELAQEIPSVFQSDLIGAETVEDILIKEQVKGDEG